MSEQESWPVLDGVMQVSEPPRRDLVALDKSYMGMYQLHRTCHVGLIKEMGEVREREGLARRVLEIAGGTGMNIGNFLEAGFEYCGLDLSETAITVAMMRHPTGRFINCAIDDTSMIADGAFDMVFCSSMLEHLEDHVSALRQMVRIARRHLFVTFFEGLADDGEDKIARYPFDNPDYLVFGKKFSDLQASYGGQYFWNRYTKRTIIDAVQLPGVVKVELLEASNRVYLKNETILHVLKH